MHDYAMLADGDRVLVAVSGGVDSLVLVHLLAVWREKAPLSYELIPVHVAMAGASSSPGAMALGLARDLTARGLTLRVVSATSDPAGEDSAARDCFTCARSRRTRLFEEARRQACNKIAFGHHQDDLIETFLLNLTCAGNISTMRPRQDLFDGRLALIRPLAYVEKAAIRKIARANGLRPVPCTCPQAGRSRRAAMQDVAADLYRRIPGAKKNIFAALGNVRSDYLLTGRQGGAETPPHPGPSVSV